MLLKPHNVQRLRGVVMFVHARRVVAIAALATVAGLVAALVPGAVGAGAQTIGQLRLAADNRRVGTSADAVRGSDVPGLAVDPGDANHIVETNVDYLNGECEYNVTFDGGATWPVSGVLSAPAGFPAPRAGFPTPLCEPGSALDGGSVAWGTGQRVYVSFTARRGTDGASALVATSTDGGRSFSTGVLAMPGGPANAPRYANPEIAVQRRPEGDRLYVSSVRQGVGNPSVAVAASIDGGVTWAAPVNASPQIAGAFFEPSSPAVAPNGDVFIAWRTPGNIGTVQVGKSTDLGVTWTRNQAAAVNDAVGFDASDTRIAVDPRNGAVYVVYMEGAQTPRQDHFINPDSDVRLVRSADGVTWSAPIRVNDDTPIGNGVAQRQPKVSVAPDGRVDIVWQDRRHAYRPPPNSHNGNGEARLADTYYAYSLDGGATFSRNRRVSDRMNNLDVGSDYRGQVYWFFGPVLVPLGTDRVMFAWQDSREGNFETDSLDIYTSVLDVRAGGPAPVVRLPGGGRPSLSVQWSKRAYPAGPDAVLFTGGTNRAVTRPVIVNEGDAGAAVAGAVLARANMAPVLATPATQLPADVKAEVKRLQPIGAFLLGGESALAPGIVKDLVASGVAEDDIKRMAGSSPADTARMVAQAMDTRSDAERAAHLPAFDGAVIVDPTSREAGAAAGLAALRRLPVLFTERDAVPAATRAALAALDVTATLVVGGSGLISDAVLSSLPGARRLDGGDAAQVSKAVAVESAARQVPTNIVHVASTDSPFDAALAGAAAARTGALLLLTPGADTGDALTALVDVNLSDGVDRLVTGSSVFGPGYRLVARDGGIFAFGGSGFFGSTGALKLNQPVVGLASTPSNLGYWTAAADGGTFAFGDARFYGSTGALKLAQPVVGMAATPTGKGYWLVARDGGVFAFGDARFFGSTGGQALAKPIVGMTATPSGRGYWLVAADGGVFAFGDAAFKGSTGSLKLVQPVVGMAATPTGKGYWLVARDGGVFAFGDAAFKGSTGAIKLVQPVVGVDATASGNGYLLTASDGGVFAFGDAVFSGSTGGSRLNQPVVGLAAGG